MVLWTSFWEDDGTPLKEGGFYTQGRFGSVFEEEPKTNLQFDATDFEAPRSLAVAEPQPNRGLPFMVVLGSGAHVRFRPRYDEILHHLRTRGNHSLVFTWESSSQDIPRVS